MAGPYANDGDIRKRLFSKSDTEFDIRPFLSNRSFMLCSCPYMSEEEDDEDMPVDCECDGKIHLDENFAGKVEKVFMDPLTQEQDLEPQFKFIKTGWTKKRPNELKLKVIRIDDASIKSCSGELLLRGERCVEKIKGRRYFSIFMDGTFKLKITPTAALLKELKAKGNRKEELTYRPIRFDLIAEENER